MEDDPQTMADSDGISVHAGFPNPAADRKGSRLSLDQLLIKHPSSSYLFRVRGNNHEALGIFDGDIALVDRAITPSGSQLVIAWRQESFTICRFSRLPKQVEPWGVIRAIIHEYQ